MINYLKNIFSFNSSKPLTGVSVSKNAFSLKRLLCGIGKSEVRENEIEITDYPFEPSIVYPTGIILASDIDAMSIEFGVCKIYVKNDIVFITSEKKEVLKQFSEVHNIEIIPHSWNWDWLLEPYLDTEFTKENEERCLVQLINNDFTKEEVNAIRKEIEKQMYAYNFDTMLWDWCSLSLSEVLSAMRAKYNKEDFRKFYKRALEIEKRIKQ
ncbi:hypothetical protein [Maribacter stanieri]|uniref:Uncharacterized protein n=1 Tax=Maribacter stanieri TaxID=440514 RepID=A0A1I6J9G1_9FLAO|nr:hypothetical protein [Maribacter stanieri]SFR75625.1 hypothetical protein SAMN04488010_2482 [Maribacter stanieri]